MAAPHVSGVAALAASVASSPMSPTALKALILGRGTTLSGASGKTVTGRLVNALRVVDTLGPTAAADLGPSHRYGHDRRLDGQHHDRVATGDGRPFERAELRRPAEDR